MIDYNNDNAYMSEYSEAYYLPRRFKSLVNQDSIMRYKAWMAIKISIYEEFDKDIDDIIQYVDSAVKPAEDMEKMVIDLSKSFKDLESEMESNPDSPDIDSIHAEYKKTKESLESALKQQQVTFAKYIEDIKSKWSKILDYREIIYNTNPGLAKSVNGMLKLSRPASWVLRQLKQTFTSLKSSVDDLKKNNRIERYTLDKDRYKGNEAIADEFKSMSNETISFIDKFLHDFPIIEDSDISDRIQRSKDLASALNGFKDKLNSFAVAIKPTGKQPFTEYQIAISPAIEPVKKSYSIVVKKMPTFDPDLNKQVANAYDVIILHFTELIKAKTKKDAMSELETVNQLVSSFVDSLIPFYLKYLDDTSNLKPPNLSSVFKFLDKSKLDISALADRWGRLYAKYPELIESAPADIVKRLRNLWRSPEIPKIITEDDLKSRVEVPYRQWADVVKQGAQDLADFSVMYTGVKSLYPLTLGLASRSRDGGDDERGRSFDNLKYVEAMNSLLNEALSGKSLNAKKSMFVNMARYFYPDNPKVLAAYRMMQLSESYQPVIQE